MLEEIEKFADRFDRLRGGLPYQKLSDAIEEKTGVRITAQAMHRWVKLGGEISEENLLVVSQYFGVSPVWLRYGHGPEKPEQSLDALVGALPGESGQEALDFIQYKFSKAEGLIASDKIASYIALLDRLRDDMKRRKKKDSGK